MEKQHGHSHTKEFNDTFYLFGHVSTKFLGHLFCGLSLVALGSWWAINMLVRYHRSRPHLLNPSPRPFRCRASFPAPCCGGLPLDGFLKIVLGLIEIAGETQGTYYAGSFHWNDTTQHLVLYGTIVLSGVLDLLVHYGAAVPRGTDLAGLAFFYGTGTLLLYYHFHSESALNSRMHVFLLWLSVGGVLSVVTELCNGTSLWASLIRAQLTLLFGTWLVQISFTLYSPLEGATGWSENSNVSLMIVLVYFCCHAQLIVLVMLVVNAMIWRRLLRRWAAEAAIVGPQHVLVVGCLSGDDASESDDVPLIGKTFGKTSN